MAGRLVSVVVPVRNGERTIGECLASLVAVDFPAADREILVVDNGSSDGTGGIIARFPVQRLHVPRRGVSRARNAAIRASHGEILAFTDSDCVVTRAWLCALLEPFADPDVGGVAGEIVGYPASTPAERYATQIRLLSPQRYLRRPTMPFAVFANLAFRREVFDRIGLLDETFVAGESADFCTRFRRASGLRLVYAPRAVVFHRHRLTAAALFLQHWNYGRGNALLQIKYGDEIPWGWRQGVSGYAEVARSVLALARGVLRFCGRRGSRDAVLFGFFDLVRRVAERLGFAREALARGYPYL